MLLVLALATTLLSAAILYAASPNCRWTSLRALRRSGVWVGIAFAFVSLALWIARFGGGAGLCAMLAAWMLSLGLWPWLAFLAIPRGAPLDAAAGND